MINAVIYVRPENYSANAARCLDHCAARHYNVVGLVPGDWQAATRMLEDGTAGVIVVAPTDRRESPEPGVEIVPRRRARRPGSTNSPASRWRTSPPGSTPAATLHR